MKTSETAKLFLSKDRFLLLTHRNPDGDTLGSASALCSALRRAGKTAYLYPNTEITDKYRPFAERYFAPEDYESAYVVAGGFLYRPSSVQHPLYKAVADRSFQGFLRRDRHAADQGFVRRYQPGGG